MRKHTGNCPVFFGSTIDGERTTGKYAGSLRETESGIVVRFSENGGETEVFLQEDSVRVIRRAESTGTYLFRKDKETEGKLVTPYGEIVVAVKTDLLSVKRTEKGVSVRIGYTAAFGGGSSRCEIMICAGENL